MEFSAQWQAETVEQFKVQTITVLQFLSSQEGGLSVDLATRARSHRLS